MTRDELLERLSDLTRHARAEADRLASDDPDTARAWSDAARTLLQLTAQLTPRAEDTSR